MRSRPGRSRPQAVAALLSGLALGCTACGPRWDTHPTSTTQLAATTSTTSATTTAIAQPSSTSSASSSSAPEESTTALAATSTTVDAATTVATITSNWETFFAPTSSIDDRVALLENGESLRAAVEQRAQDPLMGQASAKVSDVELSAAGTATVTYDVLLSGAVALPNAQGTAVLQDGVWKVGAASFCALISLGATSPIPGC